MVTIIKRGIKPAERLYEVTCGECTTVFSFKQAEAQYKSDQRDGDYLTIQCPVCISACTVQASAYVKETSNQSSYSF